MYCCWLLFPVRLHISNKVKYVSHVTCTLEVLHSRLNLLLEFLRGDNQAALKLPSLLLQHELAVSHHLLEPHPLLIHTLTQVLHL